MEFSHFQIMRKGCLRPGYAVSTWTQTTLRLALGDFPDTDRRRCGDQAVRPFALLAAGVCRRTPTTRRIADDPDILAPNLLSRGQLFDDPTTPWPYLITTRMLGSSLGKDGALHRREVRHCSRSWPASDQVFLHGDLMFLMRPSDRTSIRR